MLILLGVNLFTFMLFFTVNTPDDMARLNIGGKRVTQEQIEKWKVERGYDKPLYWNDAGRGRRQAHRHDLLGALGVAVRAATSAASDAESAGDIGHEVQHAHGREPAARACRCSSCR